MMSAREDVWAPASSAVVLIGHGSVASDTPRTLVQRLRTLEAERRRDGTPISVEERELDARVRRWPRTPRTDPYKAGVDSIAAVLRARVGRVVVAFNEFCAPSLEEAVEALAQEGVTRVTVVTTMLTPGGVHSEVDIPLAIRALEATYPGVVFRYAWPFDVEAVAALLAEACRTVSRAVPDPPAIDAGAQGRFASSREQRPAPPQPRLRAVVESSAADSADVEALARIARGEACAIGVLYDRYATHLFPSALRILRDSEEAEEILHDAFVYVADRAEDYSPERGSVAAWLQILVRNLCVQRLRGIRARGGLERGRPQGEPAALAETQKTRSAHTDERARIRRALDSLADVQRRILESAFFDGLTYGEIADREGLSLEKIKSHVYGGISSLRDALQVEERDRYGVRDRG